MGAYDELDNAILRRLDDSIRPVDIGSIWCEVLEISPVKNITILDRRMQALKKRGLVYNVKGKGWARLSK
nr:MAG TPA: Iron dependent repressor, N-terminal DNA binding domain [Caudoviricetes sp.]